MANINDYICQAIDVFFKNTPLSFDQTKIGRVTEVLSNNRYKVKIQDNFYTIKSLFNYSVNEKVFVLFPCGSTTNLYIYPNKPSITVSDVEPSSASEGDVWIKT